MLQISAASLALTGSNRHFRGCILPILSGMLLALSFPCHPENPLAILYHGGWAWTALIPLFAALQGCGFKEGFRRGWVTGFTFNLCSLYWVAHTQGGGPAVVGGTVLMAAYLGLFIAVFAGLLGGSMQRWGRRALLLAPVLWSAQEYLLSLGELGFPWLLLGNTQAVFPALIQYASITGVYGVSFWLALVNVLVFLILAAPMGIRRRTALLGGLVLWIAGPWVHGRASIPPSSLPGPKMRVALVQPNLSREEKWGPGGLGRSFATLESLSRQAAARNPALLVWPETALPCYLRWRPGCRGRVERLVKDLRIPLLTGASDYGPSGGEPYNSAFFASPGHPDLQVYAKMHLVPFGERTPFRDSIPLLRGIDWTALTGDLGPAEFARGREHTLFSHSEATFAVLICFESVFPDLARQRVQAGAQLLINITNDSWFGRTAGPYQHAQLAVLRAVENRTSIARCATSGISLFIDPFGRTYQATGIFEPAVRVGDVDVGGGLTFYTRHGDLFARAMLLGAVVCLAGLVAVRVKGVFARN